MANERTCPCNYGNPCDTRCSCVNEFSSYGCKCCCTYGNEEQRKQKSELIKSKLLGG